MMPINENEHIISTMRYYWVVTTKELTAESFIVLWIVFLVGSCDIVTGMLDIWEAYTPMLGFVYNKELLSWGLHSWKASQLLQEHHTNSCFKISSYCSGIGRSLEYLLTTEQYMFRLLNNFGCGWLIYTLPGSGIETRIFVHKHKN